jgi:hypothetical protein
MIYEQSVTRPLAPVEIVRKLHEVVETLFCRNSLSSHKVTKPRALVAMHGSVTQDEVRLMSAMLHGLQPGCHQCRYKD